jgi:hypothetical protein
MKTDPAAQESATWPFQPEISLLFVWAESEQRKSQTEI